MYPLGGCSLMSPWKLNMKPSPLSHGHLKELPALTKISFLKREKKEKKKWEALRGCQLTLYFEKKTSKV